MKPVLALILCCAPGLAAVTGQVVNRTTDRPQAGAAVALYKLGEQTNPELLGQAKSDARGNFTIQQEAQGPTLIRTEFDGVTYSHMLPPGSPTAGITVEVYSASKAPGSAKVAKHMILLEPSGGQMVVSETYLLSNDGKTAWYDPDHGTLHFYLPPEANGKVQVNATAPGGMPVGATVKKTSKPDVYAVDFAVKPGETRFDLTYTAPYTEGAPYEGKVITKDENTYLIVPNGVTIQGDNLNDLGPEPRTQAHVYGLTGNAYKVELTSADQQDSGPRIEQIMPRLYGKASLIVALALGILALGFILLYRAKEANERGRR